MVLSEIERAAKRLQGVIHQTPVSSSRTFSEMSGTQLYLKCENLQKTGSFKVRGAYNKIARMAESGPLPALVAASAGNHAQGVAYAAKVLGAQATIVMPRATPIAKVSATEGYGVEVVLQGDGYDAAYDHAMKLCEERGAAFVHPFDDADVIAGQGTLSLEILCALPTVDAVLIPAGGGGLLAGMAACVKQINPRVRVIGVQAEGADAIVRSFREGTNVTVDRAATIADGIAVKRPGKQTVEMIREYVDEMVTVSDAEIAEAILLLLERNKMVVEPAGASSLAAALNRKADLDGRKIVCVLSGGNIDVGFIHRVVEKGLVTRGRQIKFKAVMGDVPGNLQKVSTIIAECGGNVILVQHDRLHTNLQLGEAILHVACEVSSREHGEQMLERLRAGGYEVQLEC